MYLHGYSKYIANKTYNLWNTTSYYIIPLRLIHKYYAYVQRKLTEK